MDPCEIEILFKSPHDYHHLTKHCEGPCCFLQCNSTGVTLPEQLPPIQLSKLQPLKGVSLKETETTQRTQYFLDSPLETEKGFYFFTHTVHRLYNCSGVPCYEKCQAMESGRQEGVKMGIYFIASVRPPAKHATPENSNSCSLLIQDLPPVAQAWKSVCSTDN